MMVATCAHQGIGFVTEVLLRKRKPEREGIKSQSRSYE